MNCCILSGAPWGRMGSFSKGRTMVVVVVAQKLMAAAAPMQTMVHRDLPSIAAGDAAGHGGVAASRDPTVRPPPVDLPEPDPQLPWSNRPPSTPVAAVLPLNLAPTSAHIAANGTSPELAPPASQSITRHLHPDPAFQNKLSQTRRGPKAKASQILKNGLHSSQLPPQKRSNLITSSRRQKTNKDKLDTEIFELCMEDVWSCIDPENESDYAYFDSLWFNIYEKGNDKSNVLRWIKAKKIFSRRYVFVPIVGRGHWSLLVLCNFGETNYLGTEKGSRMLLLDSLTTTNTMSLRTSINRFVADILKNEEREELEQFISKVELEFPEVPQQSGDDCGIYVLYFIYCFLVIEELGEDLSDLGALFDSEELETLEDIRKDIHSYREKKDAEISE